MRDLIFSSTLHVTLFVSTLLGRQSADFPYQSKQSLPPLPRTGGAATTSFKQIDTNYSMMNINNFQLWFHNTGAGAARPFSDNGAGGGFFPKGTAPVIYIDGMVWGGKVFDGNPQVIRTGGQRYDEGTSPGIILGGSIQPPKRIYRIRNDYRTADLTDEVATFLTEYPNDRDSLASAIRERYAMDWAEWPSAFGAPFYDNNKNGVFDDGDEPGLLDADQVIWFVANDAAFSYPGEPIGLEEQVTLWAYSRNSVLKNVIFKRVRLIYKGLSTTPPGSRIDSMFVCQFSDLDVGNAGDDLAGCDTTRQMVFAYNASRTDEQFAKYNLMPPAVGYVLLQGPIVESSSKDIAIFDFSERSGFSNLRMSSFVYQSTFFKCFDVPPPQREVNTSYWRLLRGYQYDCRIVEDSMFAFPPGYSANFFPLTGDPVTGKGFLDGLNQIWSPGPGNRRIYLNVGPFSMSLGDTQEVVIAYVGGLGSDRLSSVRAIQFYAQVLQGVYPHPEILLLSRDSETPKTVEQPLDYFLRQNYPNPFNPSTTMDYEIPLDLDVKLTVYDILGREVKTLVNSHEVAGTHHASWDGKDAIGLEMPSGVYFYRLQAGHVTVSRKMLLLH